MRASGDEVNRRSQRTQNEADSGVVSEFPATVGRIHGFRFRIGLRVAVGELFGVNVELAGILAGGLLMGNANEADGNGEGVPGGVDEGDGEGLGVGLGVGEGIIFSQRCNDTVAPPISLVSVSQRA